MSDDEQVPSTSEGSSRLLTAEYKDGQLEIVEVAPFDKEGKIQNFEGHIISDKSGEDGEVKYMKVLDSSNNVVVDLLNLTLVRCEDGQQAYRLVSNEESGDDTTVTCVLSNEEGDDQEGQDESYVVIEGEEGPVVFLQSALQQANHEKTADDASQKKSVMSPTEILEKAKALQKAKALMSVQSTRGRNRKRAKSELPPPHELLSSPQFKLFLYSCKMCSFKCNAIKELTAHKATEHSSGGGKWRGGGRASTVTLQCARCPYRANTHTQLMKHVKEKHIENWKFSKVYLENVMAVDADVLVCGACGFESGDRELFKRHVETEHGVR